MIAQKWIIVIDSFFLFLFLWFLHTYRPSIDRIKMQKKTMITTVNQSIDDDDNPERERKSKREERRKKNTIEMIERFGPFCCCCLRENEHLIMLMNWIFLFAWRWSRVLVLLLLLLLILLIWVCRLFFSWFIIISRKQNSFDSYQWILWNKKKSPKTI